MGYLSCRADSSAATCRSITAISPLPISRRSGARLPPASPPEIERFSYDDLEAATSHFADAALLGRGSHGAVYKAVLPSGRAVAVKRPSPRRAEVDNEIRILSSLRGPRLVNLLGYSDPGPQHRLGRERLLALDEFGGEHNKSWRWGCGERRYASGSQGKGGRKSPAVVRSREEGEIRIQSGSRAHGLTGQVGGS